MANTPSQFAVPDDPVLGACLAHYTTNRLRLLIQGGVIYALAVIGLQLLFWNTNAQLRAVLLPLVFALVATGVYWYMAHLWNREVILYALGFTYRRGSQVGAFRYEQIVGLRVRAEQVSLAGFFRREVYDCKMTTDQDEHLHLNNLYGNVGKLVLKLEKAITEARVPVVKAQLARGERVPFGVIELSEQGLEANGDTLLWASYVGYGVQGGKLEINGWQAFSLGEISHLLLLITLLKERG